jgi:hypothetical protein
MKHEDIQLQPVFKKQSSFPSDLKRQLKLFVESQLSAFLFILNPSIKGCCFIRLGRLSSNAISIS